MKRTETQHWEGVFFKDLFNNYTKNQEISRQLYFNAVKDIRSNLTLILLTEQLYYGLSKFMQLGKELAFENLRLLT